MSVRLRSKTGPSANLPGAVPRPNARSKQWVFYSRLDTLPSKTDDVSFLLFQEEKHPITGRHYQGYAEFSRRLRASEAAMALGFPVFSKNKSIPLNSEGKPGNYGLRIRLGTQTEAIRYCSSSWYCRWCHAGDSVGFGACAKACEDGCGRRESKYRVSETTVIGQPGEDMTFSATHTAIVADIKAGKRKREVYEDYPAFSRPFWRWIDRQFELYQPVRDFQPGVYWLWGESGSGKSRIAKALCTDTYFKGPDTKWFDGYDGQSMVVINDMRKSTFSFSYLLELFDRYPLRVETKGGSVQLVNKCFVITCSKPPDELWAEIAGSANEAVQQLMRRMTRVVEFPLATAVKHQLVRLIRLHVQHGCISEGDLEFGSWTPGEPVPVVSTESIEGGDASAGPPPAEIPMALDTRPFPTEGEASEAETLQLGMASLTL